jgi:hypothetical protein
MVNSSKWKESEDDREDYAHKKIVCQATKWHFYVFCNIPIDPPDPGRPIVYSHPNLLNVNFLNVKTDILISAIALKRLSEYIHGEKLGATPIKGKKDPVEIFKLA